MRVRIFTTRKKDRIELQATVSGVNVTVPVGEQGLFDANLTTPESIRAVQDWCVSKELSYEVHES